MGLVIAGRRAAVAHRIADLAVVMVFVVLESHVVIARRIAHVPTARSMVLLLTMVVVGHFIRVLQWTGNLVVEAVREYQGHVTTEFFQGRTRIIIDLALL